MANLKLFPEVTARAVVSRSDSFLHGSARASDWYLVWRSPGIDPKEADDLQREVTPQDLPGGSQYCLGVGLSSGRFAFYCGFHGRQGTLDRVEREGVARGFGIVLLPHDARMVLAAMRTPRELGQFILRHVAMRLAADQRRPAEAGLPYAAKEAEDYLKERITRTLSGAPPSFSLALREARAGRCVDVVIPRPASSKGEEGLSQMYHVVRILAPQVHGTGSPPSFLVADSRDQPWRVRFRGRGSPVVVEIPAEEWQAWRREAQGAPGEVEA